MNELYENIYIYIIWVLKIYPHYFESCTYMATFSDQWLLRIWTSWPDMY